MTDRSLLSQIGQEIESLASYIATCKEAMDTDPGEPPSVISQLSRYNYETMLEILNQETNSDVSVEKGRENAMREALHSYLMQYAPGKKDLARYITAISLYLTFYAKQPLHPPDMVTDDIRIEKRDDEYYCTGKNRYLYDEPSLCRFCVCKPYIPE